MKRLQVIHHFSQILVLLCTLGLMSLPGFAYESEGQVFTVEPLTKQQDVIFGFDFLPNGDILFTERGGTLKRLNPRSGRVAVVSGTPAVAVGGQGGLLDVRLPPDFEQDPWVYLTYSESLGNGNKTTAWGRGRLEGDQLKDFQRVFSAHASNGNDIHFGARIEFDGQNHLFVSIGERNDRQKAQDLAYHNGKILRFNRDGSIPCDNPFHGKSGVLPEIWSLGHRNPQGLAFNAITQTLWSAEFGPMGGDEINRIRPGLNYGWPIITYGREYYGLRIGEGTEKPGLEQPIVYYVPSISPSGIGFYSGDSFPAWRGNLFVAALSGQQLRRLVIEGERVVRQEILLDDRGWAFRAVRSGPDGYLYFSTNDGRIARLVPEKFGY